MTAYSGKQQDLEGSFEILEARVLQGA